MTFEERLQEYFEAWCEDEGVDPSTADFEAFKQNMLDEAIDSSITNFEYARENYDD